MKLTKTQADIINHRLTCPDAIIESLTDDYATWAEDEIEAAIRDLELLVHIGSIDVAKLTPCAVDVLANCCEASTYLTSMHDACENGDVSRHSLRAATKQAERLAEMVSRETGRHVAISVD